jgi:hypothetical protein
MAEKLLLVCDTCGLPAVETVTFRSSVGNRQKDFCAKHLRELLLGSRVPKRGRKPRASQTASTPHAKGASPSRKPKRVTVRKKAVARKVAGARPGYSKNGKRLGRPPGSKAKKAVAKVAP